MKKINLCLVILLALLLCTSCTKEVSVQVPESSETEAPKEEPPKVGISIYRYDDVFMGLYRAKLKACLKDTYGVSVMMNDAGAKPDKQLEQIAYYIEQGYHGIIVNMVQPDDAGLVVDMCREAQIPVVFINREPKPEELERWKKEKIKASYVGADSNQSGTFQGEIILDMPRHGDINGDGVVTYAMIKGDGQNIDTYYRSLFPVKALKDAGVKTSGVFVWPGNWREDEAYEAAGMALENYGHKLDVIFCNNDAMAIGAWRAVNEAGRRVGKDIYLVGVDALDEAVEMVVQGNMTGTVLNDYTGQAEKAADVIVSMMEGERNDIKYTVDYLKITGVSDYPFTLKQTEEK